MRAGLTAGAVAAIIAVLVSLPLHSPVDSAFNSATVAIGCLVLGLVAGLLWNRMGERPLLIIGALLALFVLVLIVAFVGNSFLDRFVSFVLPLAAIAFVAVAALTPLLSSYFSRPDLGWKGWTPIVPVAVALVLGFALVTQGDAESGDLALPPPPTASPASAVPTVTTAARPTSVAEAPTATTAPVGATLAAVATRQATAVSATATATQPQATGAPTAMTSGSETADRGQQFVIGEGSEITFTVEEELGRTPIRFDAVISSTGLTGVANLDGQPSVVTLDLHSLRSDQQFRDQYIRSRLFPDTPEAVVTVDQLPDLPESFFDGEETTGTLSGSLQIGASVTPLEFDVTARHDVTAISLLGKATFTWEQLGLAKPTARSVVYLADEVRVQVRLIAKAAP
jgi:hypothetical protein